MHEVDKNGVILPWNNVCKGSSENVKMSKRTEDPHILANFVLAFQMLCAHRHINASTQI